MLILKRASLDLAMTMRPASPRLCARTPNNMTRESGIVNIGEIGILVAVAFCASTIRLSYGRPQPNLSGTYLEMKSIQFAVAAVALAATSAASALTATYTSPAEFLAWVAPGSNTQGFDDPSFSLEPSFKFGGGAFIYTVSAPGGLYGNGIFIGTNFPGESLTVTFTGFNVSAFGGNFYATNIDGAFQATPITLTLSDGTTSTFTPSSATTGSFRGFTTDFPSINSFTIASTGAVFVGMDNFTVGSVGVVPEPTSYMLFALGLGGLLLARRRQASV